MKLLTKKLESQFEKQGDTSELEAHEIKIIAHFFFGSLDWWVYERDIENPDIFWAFVNLGDSQCAECGTISLDEIQSLLIKGVWKIERDLYWNQETTLMDIQKKIKPWMYQDEEETNSNG